MRVFGNDMKLDHRLDRYCRFGHRNSCSSLHF
jgi:hypothetical protein